MLQHFSFFTDFISNKRTPLLTADTKFIEAAMIDIKTAAQNVITIIQDELRQSEAPELTRKVPEIQHAVNVVANGLQDKEYPERGLANMTILDFHLYFTLKEILDALRLQWSDYFNTDIHLPDLKPKSSQEGARQKRDKAHAILQALQIDETLIDTIFQPLDRIISEQKNTKTTEELYLYYDTLLGATIRSSAKWTRENATEALLGLLIHHNFNAPQMVQFFKGYFQKELPAQNPAQAAARLREAEAFVERQNKKSQSGVLPMVVNLREQLLDWLQSETGYYESDVMPDTDRGNGKPFFTNCSPETMAATLYLLQSFGIICTNKQDDLITWACEQINYSRKRKVSPKEFKELFYRASRDAKQDAAQLLTMMGSLQRSLLGAPLPIEANTPR